MYLDSTKKEEIFSQYGQGAKDTGSAESQIALFTYRIKHLTEHMKQNRKDHSWKFITIHLYFFTYYFFIICIKWWYSE